MIDSLSSSKAIKRHPAHKKALTLIKDHCDGDYFKISGQGGKKFKIVYPAYTDHVAYFLVEFEDTKTAKPLKIYYYDAWNGTFGKNSSGYSFGETVFAPRQDLDADSLVKAIKANKKLFSPNTGKEAAELFESFAKTDATGKLEIVGKGIPTKVQKRTSCYAKSTSLLERGLAYKIDPKLEITVAGIMDPAHTSCANFPEFEEDSVIGKGREEYKRFKHSYIAETVADLVGLYTSIPGNPLLGKRIITQLEDVRDKAISKNHPDIIAAISIVLPPLAKAAHKMDASKTKPRSSQSLLNPKSAGLRTKP